jgi:hypothetical protein
MLIHVRLKSLSVAQSVAAIIAVSAGLGVLSEDLSDAAEKHAKRVCNLYCLISQVRQRLTQDSQIVFAAEIIFIVVVYMCKIAVCLLLHRLASQRFKRVYAVAVIAACGACCVASVLAVAIHETGSWLSSQNSARSLVIG